MGKTAFVFSGGGSLGAIQVGMLLALTEYDIEPDLIVGTSVGAVNAAWLAGSPGEDGAQKLAEIWKGIRRTDIFPVRALTGLLGFSGRSNHLVDSRNFRQLLARNIGYKRLEDASIPIKVVATELSTGREVVLDQGDAVDAIAASAALPGVFPPVTIGGRRLVDGGIANYTPISHAVAERVSTVYVLPTGYACSLHALPKGAVGVAIQAVSLLMHQRLSADILTYQDTVDLRVLPALCPLNVSPIDFSRSSTLIDHARAATIQWLESGGLGGSRELLSLHSHFDG